MARVKGSADIRSAKVTGQVATAASPDIFNDEFAADKELGAATGRVAEAVQTSSDASDARDAFELGVKSLQDTQNRLDNDQSIFGKDFVPSMDAETERLRTELGGALSPTARKLFEDKFTSRALTFRGTAGAKGGVRQAKRAVSTFNTANQNATTALGELSTYADPQAVAQIISDLEYEARTAVAAGAVREDEARKTVHDTIAKSFGTAVIDAVNGSEDPEQALKNFLDDGNSGSNELNKLMNKTLTNKEWDALKTQVARGVALTIGRQQTEEKEVIARESSDINIFVDTAVKADTGKTKAGLDKFTREYETRLKAFQEAHPEELQDDEIARRVESSRLSLIKDELIRYALNTENPAETLTKLSLGEAVGNEHITSIHAELAKNEEAFKGFHGADTVAIRQKSAAKATRLDDGLGAAILKLGDGNVDAVLTAGMNAIASAGLTDDQVAVKAAKFKANMGQKLLTDAQAEDPFKAVAKIDALIADGFLIGQAAVDAKAKNTVLASRFAAAKATEGMAAAYDEYTGLFDRFNKSRTVETPDGERRVIGATTLREIDAAMVAANGLQNATQVKFGLGLFRELVSQTMTKSNKTVNAVRAKDVKQKFIQRYNDFKIKPKKLKGGGVRAKVDSNADIADLIDFQNDLVSATLDGDMAQSDLGFFLTGLLPAIRKRIGQETDGLINTGMLTGFLKGGGVDVVETGFDQMQSVIDNFSRDGGVEVDNEFRSDMFTLFASVAKGLKLDELKDDPETKDVDERVQASQKLANLVSRGMLGKLGITVGPGEPIAQRYRYPTGNMINMGDMARFAAGIDQSGTAGIQAIGMENLENGTWKDPKTGELFSALFIKGTDLTVRRIPQSKK